MNNLNSVLLEGKICEAVRHDDNTVRFKIETVRFFKENEATVNEICHFNVVSYGRLALHVATFKSGDLVRIVGRLKEMDNSVVVIAEHVERKH